MGLLGLWPSGYASDLEAQHPYRPPQEPMERTDVFTPLIVSVIAPPNHVLGADGQVHLVYELMLVNPSAALVTVEAVRVLDRDRDAMVLDALQDARLAAVMRVTGDEDTGTTLGPSHSGYLWMDVILPKGARIPSAIAHEISLSLKVRAQRLDDHHGVPPQEGGEVPPSVRFVGSPALMSAGEPIVLDPPLRGPRWVAGAGCCSLPNGHRGAILSINGTIYVAERFAIDFLQLDETERLFTGDKSKLASYKFYGAQVHAASAGIVVDARDGMPDEVPGRLPQNMTAEKADGNHVVMDMGEGRFALYAHLKPGSVRVQKGAFVKRGQVIGLLGNSGNSSAPHLHFHVMDSLSPLLSNGLPYVFSSFQGQGLVTSEVAVDSGNPAPIDREYLRGPHRNELPLNLQVIDFDQS